MESDHPLNLELTLHNSFELLEVGEINFADKAKEVDEKFPIISDDDLSSDNDVEVSLEKGSFLHNIDLEAPSKLKSGPSKKMPDVTNKPHVDDVNGNYPIRSSSSLELSSKDGRMSLPSAAPVTTNLALDPDNVDGSILQTIISPITTSNEVLGPDKRKIHSVEDTNQATEASIKSTNILSKLWSDYNDNDLDTEPESDLHNLIDTSKYLETPGDTNKKGKRGRPKKQRSPLQICYYSE